jgi:hypothetical protein
LGITALWNIPNVNPRNNTFTFHSVTDNADYTAVLPSRYYNPEIPAELNQLATDIQTILNAAGSSLTFTVAPVAGNPRRYTITSAGGQYWFDSNCTAAKNGEQMYGLTFSNPPVPATTTTAFFNGVYTQYVDIVSKTLTKYAKVRTTTTNNRSSILIRAYIGDDRNGLVFYAPGIYLAYAWNFAEPLNNFDIEFYDQNGDPLWVPDPTKFIWQMTLEAEL